MLLKKANTITTPTAYSNGFLHSVKPEVVENLLVQSNQFDTTWTETNASVTSGQNGVYGTNDAWLLQNNTNSGFVNQNVSTTGVSVFSVYAKAGNVNFIRVRADYSSIATTYFDLANGTIGTESSVIKSEITSVGNGWYRCSIVFDGTTTKVRLYPAISDGDTSGLDNSIYIQDAQLNKGYSAYPYLETTTEAKPSADFTFTRNSSATRVNELGYIEDVQIIGGELVSNGDFEEIGSELITNGSFDTDSDWTKGTGWSIANGKASCDGTNSPLDQYSVTTVGKTYKVQLTVSDMTTASVNVRLGMSSSDIIGSITDNGTYTFYGKVASDTTLRVRSSGGFDGSIDNVSVKEVGQDWTFGANASIEDGVVNILNSPSQLSLQQNIGISQKTIRLTYTISNYVSGGIRPQYGAINGLSRSANGTYTELITGSSPSTDINFYTITANTTASIDNISVKQITDDTNLPRINYEGFTYENGLPVPYSGKGHLLLEPQSTNLRELSNTYVGDATIRGTISNDASAVSPSGLLGVEYLTATGTNGLVLDSSALTGDGTFSVYLKRKTGVGDIRMSINGGISYTTMAVTDVWKRFSLSSTTGLGQLVISCLTSGDEVYIWGWQEEALSYPTSYIPTNGTAVTRLGETCNNATHSFPSEGVLYAEIAALANDLTDRRISISDGTFNNNIQIYYYVASNRVRTLINSGGIVSFDYNHILPDLTEYHKFAVRYKDNDFSFWIDGVQVGTDTSGNAPTGLSELHFANILGTSSNFYGKTKMVATFPYLSNDEMECLTGEGYGTFEALAAAYSYTIK